MEIKQEELNIYVHVSVQIGEENNPNEVEN